MKETLSQKQLTQICACLDDCLTPLEKQMVEQELQRNLLFKQTYEELQYTRRILRSLPQKRAPRNFTFSASAVKAPVRRGWLQPAMGFVSAAAALAVVVLFVGTSLLPHLGAAKTAPSQEVALQAEAPVAASDSSRSIMEAAPTPQIFLWNSGGYGKGGGGGTDMTGAATGIGGGAPEVFGFGGGAPLTPTEEPTLSAEALATADPANLILGIPAADAAGETDQAAQQTAPLRRAPLNTSTWLEIILGAVAVVTGATAYLLHRRR